MKTINHKRLKVFGARFMLATLLASFAAYSQDIGTEDSGALDVLEPAADTSAQTESAADTSAQAEVTAFK